MRKSKAKEKYNIDADLRCPYCNAENDVNTDDGGREPDVAHEMYCCECDELFKFWTLIHFTYEPEAMTEKERNE